MKTNWLDLVDEMDSSRKRLEAEINKYIDLASKARKADFPFTAILIDDTIKTLKEILNGGLYNHE